MTDKKQANDQKMQEDIFTKRLAAILVKQIQSDIQQGKTPRSKKVRGQT